MIIVNKSEEYVIFKPESTLFEESMSYALEKLVAGLYASEGQINFIVDLNDTTLLSDSAVVLFDKIQKIAIKEAGLFVTVVNNDKIIDIIADNSQFELLMLSTVDEAIEAVYINTSGNDNSDDEYDMDNDY